MVEVTEDDKEIAAELAHALGMTAEEFTSGACDVLVQIAARHRQAGVQQGLDMAAGVAGCERFPAGHVEAAWTDGDDGPQHYNQACDDIAAAIRILGGDDA